MGDSTTGGFGDLEPMPDLPPPDATPEEIAEHSRERQRIHAANNAKIAKLEEAAERIIAETSRNGLTSEEADEIAKARDGIAALKMMAASISEQAELGREIGRKKGYDV